MQNGDKASPRCYLHKLQEANGLVPLYTLYNVSELVTLLQGYMLLCFVVVPG